MGATISIASHFVESTWAQEFLLLLISLKEHGRNNFNCLSYRLKYMGATISIAYEFVESR